MQFRATVGAQTNDVAGIRRYFGLDQDNMEHTANHTKFPNWCYQQKQTIGNL